MRLKALEGDGVEEGWEAPGYLSSIIQYSIIISSNKSIQNSHLSLPPWKAPQIYCIPKIVQQKMYLLVGNNLAAYLLYKMN